MQNRIFSTDSPKAIKADAYGYLNAIHYMAPADTSGVNLCPHASAGCKALCLGWTSGQAGIVSDLDSKSAQGNACRQSRLDKARRFMKERNAYMQDVVRSIEAEERKAARLGKKLCVRMNGSTDIAWEGIACVRDGKAYRNLMSAFPHIQFVDYTKIARRFDRQLPPNYHLTFSRSETNETEAVALLARGFNVAVVFADTSNLVAWHGYDVIDGDAHDLRHLDKRGNSLEGGYVVGLTPKGRKAKKDTSGFVVR